ncbi:MAG: mechanosensitive ion channel domain-containing protein [Melioribacteraceae bacterium]
MKELTNFNISELNIITIVVLGLLLFFFLQIIKKYFIVRLSISKYQQLYFLVEVIIWIIFGSWILRTFFKDSIYYSIGIATGFTIAAVWFAWFVAKDFIAGIVFRLNDTYKKGNLLILTDNLQGYIENINYLTIDLSTPNGEIIKIPYSKIQGKIHKKSLITKSTQPFQMEIKVPQKNTLEITKNKLRRIILISPGVKVNSEPKIQLKKEEENNWIFEISVYLINESYLNVVKANIEKIKN